MQTSQPTSSVLRHTPRATAAALESVQNEFQQNWARYLETDQTSGGGGGGFTLSMPLEVYCHLPRDGAGAPDEPNHLQFFVHNRRDGVVVGTVSASLEDGAHAIRSVGSGRAVSLHAVLTQAQSELEQEQATTARRVVYEPRIIDIPQLHFLAVWMHPVQQETEATSAAAAGQGLVFPVVPPFPVDYLQPGHPSRFPLATMMELLAASEASRRALYAGKSDLCD